MNESIGEMLSDDTERKTQNTERERRRRATYAHLASNGIFWLVRQLGE